MALPKSRVRYQKSGITFIDNTEAVEWTMTQLTRAALRDVSIFVRKTFKTSYYSHFNKITGDAGKATKGKIWATDRTLYPRVDIGLKTGKAKGFYAYYQEFGTSAKRPRGHSTPKLGLLQHSVKDNTTMISSIMAQYLGELDKDNPVAGISEDVVEEESEV